MYKFNLKKTVAVLSTVVLPLAASAEGCGGGGTDKADKAPVVVCRTAGYHKAGRAEKAAKGTFFTCGGPKCKITVYFKNTKTSTDRRLYITRPDAGTFTIPKDAQSFGSSKCGTIYKKNVKKA